MTTYTVTPKLYVGTYAKYVSGSIAGAWLELEGHDKESFLEACRELHKDETDPELMFQDFEGFPKEFHQESYLTSSLFEWLELSEDDRELLAAYVDAFGDSYDEATVQKAQDAFAGKTDSEAEFAETFCEDTCSIPDGLPSFLRACIDWQAVWNSSLRFDFVRSGEFFFHNC